MPRTYFCEVLNNSYDVSHLHADTNPIKTIADHKVFDPPPFSQTQIGKSTVIGVPTEWVGCLSAPPPNILCLDKCFGRGFDEAVLNRAFFSDEHVVMCNMKKGSKLHTCIDTLL